MGRNGINAEGRGRSALADPPFPLPTASRWLFNRSLKLESFICMKDSISNVIGPVPPTERVRRLVEPKS